jgi:hypothetical protein
MEPHSFDCLSFDSNGFVPSVKPMAGEELPFPLPSPVSPLAAEKRERGAGDLIILSSPSFSPSSLGADVLQESQKRIKNPSQRSLGAVSAAVVVRREFDSCFFGGGISRAGKVRQCV